MKTVKIESLSGKSEINTALLVGLASFRFRYSSTLNRPGGAIFTCALRPGSGRFIRCLSRLNNSSFFIKTVDDLQLKSYSVAVTRK
jgi:hypothetical protein